MIHIRASSLGTFNICPYKYKYDKYDLDQKIAYFGDIIHYSGRSDKESSKKLLEYYNKYINPDLQLKKIGEKIIDKLTDYMSNLSKDYDLYYEVPFIDVSDTYILQGTADVVAIHKDTEEILVIDYKTASNHSWYKGEEIWNESMQPTIYTNFAMKVWGKNKAKFRYVVLEKKSGALLKEYEREFTLKDTDKKIQDTIYNLIEAETFNDFEARECRYCYFCKLKSECPLYKLKESEDEIPF